MCVGVVDVLSSRIRSLSRNMLLMPVSFPMSHKICDAASDSVCIEIASSSLKNKRMACRSWRSAASNFVSIVMVAAISLAITFG